MAKAKRRTGRGLERNADADADVESESFMEEVLEDLPATNKSARGRRPRREMRERIEARDEERLLTRELSDWESYERDLDSEKT